MGVPGVCFKNGPPSSLGRPAGSPPAPRTEGFWALKGWGEPRAGGRKMGDYSKRVPTLGDWLLYSDLTVLEFTGGSSS